MSKALRLSKALCIEPLSRIPPGSDERLASAPDSSKSVVCALRAPAREYGIEDVPDPTNLRVPRRKRSRGGDQNLRLLASCSEPGRMTKWKSLFEATRIETTEVRMIDLPHEGVGPNVPMLQIGGDDRVGERPTSLGNDNTIGSEERPNGIGEASNRGESGNIAMDLDDADLHDQGMILLDEIGRGNGFDVFLELEELQSNTRTVFLRDLFGDDYASEPSTIESTLGLEGPAAPLENIPIGRGGEGESLRAIRDLASSSHFRESVSHLHANSVEFSSGLGKLKDQVILLCDGLAMGERERDSLNESFVHRLKTIQELHEEEKATLVKQLEVARESHLEENASLKQRCISLEGKLKSSQDAGARATACLAEFHSLPRHEPATSGPDMIVQAAEFADMEQRLLDMNSLLVVKDRELNTLRVALGEARADSMPLRRISAAGVMPLDEVRSLLAVEREHGQAEGQCSLARVAAGDGVGAENLREWHFACPAHPELRRFHPWFPFSQEEILLSREFDWRRIEGIPWVPPSVDSSLSFAALFGNIERIYVNPDVRDIERIEGNRSDDPSWIRMGDRFVGPPEVGSSRFARSGRRRVIESARLPLSFLPPINDLSTAS